MAYKYHPWPREALPLKIDIVHQAGQIEKICQLCLNEIQAGNAEFSDMMIEPMWEKGRSIKATCQTVKRMTPKRRGAPPKWSVNITDVYLISTKIIYVMEEAHACLPKNRYITVKKCLELAQEQAQKINPLIKRIPDPEPELDPVWDQIEDIIK